MARWAYFYIYLVNFGFYTLQLNYNDDCFPAYTLIVFLHGWGLSVVASWANHEDEREVEEEQVKQIESV